MLRLTSGQRRVLADKVPDVANLAIGAWFFGQLLADRPFSFRLAAFGVGTWLALVALALYFAAEDPS
jgi:hypothetical protein